MSDGRQASDADLIELMRAIAAGDGRASQLLMSRPTLATAQIERGASRERSRGFFLDEVSHYVYAGDTALHIAAVSYRVEFARVLVAAGAEVAAKNRRGAQPLHYAADGGPGHSHWNPPAQAATVRYLIEAGADPNATDASGVAPLHRAVRTRCSAAVSALLDGGADPTGKNKNGSTPLTLATLTTGRGGSGTEAANREQSEIIGLLEQHRAMG